MLHSGLLPRYGIRRVGIAGYPEGHPQIASPLLWQALHDKQSFLRDQGLEGEIVTQFSFDADPVVDWLAQLRRQAIVLPVRLGLAGPASIKILLRFAARCGVGVSARAMGKYGMSLTSLLGTTGPEQMLTELATRLDARVHGDTMLHFYPFGGLQKTAGWIADRLKQLP